MSSAKFVAVIEWQVQTTWFELDTRTRIDYTRQIRDIIALYPAVRFRWFDAEAWTGKFTDFTLCEFDDLDSYNSLWGDLRRHAFLSTPFAYVSRVILGMEIESPPEEAELDESVAKTLRSPSLVPLGAPIHRGLPDDPQPASLDGGPAVVELVGATSDASASIDPRGRPLCAVCQHPVKATAKFCSACGSANPVGV